MKIKQNRWWNCFQLKICGNEPRISAQSEHNTLTYQRRTRWADVLQMFCVCWEQGTQRVFWKQVDPYLHVLEMTFISKYIFTSSKYPCFLMAMPNSVCDHMTYFHVVLPIQPSSIYIIMTFINVNKIYVCLSATAHGVVATLNQRQWSWFNVATTSCAQS